jgi:hypothetical protein
MKFTKFTALSAALASASLGLSACGSSAGLSSGPLAPETPGLTTGVNSGGTGSATDPLAVFTAQASFIPTAKQSLEIISILGSTVTTESAPSMSLVRTTTGFNMTLSQGTVQYDTRSGSTNIASGTNTYTNCFTACTGTSPQRVTVTFTSGAASTLTYSTYGVWTRTTTTGLLGMGVFATGTPTATTNMPTTGAGTFTGNAVGYVATGNAATNVSFAGTATINADFASRTLSGSITNITSTSIATPTTTGTLGSIVFGSTTYSGNTFAGSALASGSATDAIDLSGATGTYGGVFYGFNAVEAAGSFAVTKSGANVIGVFGVKR